METNEKDKKSTVKKILFYFSLVPYGVFIVWGVINHILGRSGDRLLGCF